MADRVQVLIADDHPLFIRGLRQTIDADPGFVVVAEANDGESALHAIREQRPSVAVLDLRMPGMTGFEIARAVRRDNVPVSIIFLTMHNEEDMFNEAMELGAMGYILKENAATDILQALKSVVNGKPYISALLSHHLLRRSDHVRTQDARFPALRDLTPMEVRILKMVSTNMTSREIGKSLNISPKTVETHRVNIARKLGLKGSHSLLKFAIEHKSSL